MRKQRKQEMSAFRLESTCERIPTGSLQKNSDNCEIWQKLFSLLGSWYNKQIKKPMTGILIGKQKYTRQIREYFI